ncbi:MAG: Ni/Fe hydrogenase subunit alpha [Candidatus Sigynarchaeum springense]
MTKEYAIEPVTRLEGHGNLRIKVNGEGNVDDVKFSVTSTRFFEKFLEGRLMETIPIIAPRICGICPVPHHVAATKAVENAWGVVSIPPAAVKLRQLICNAKQYASHVLHFYALAAPDFIMGPFAPPEQRNVVAIIKTLPDVGRMALEMMDFGQSLCDTVGARSVHPVSVAIGGFQKSITREQQDHFLKRIEKQFEYMDKTIEIGMKVVNDYWDLITSIGTDPTWYIGMTNDGTHDLYEGNIRVMDPEGRYKDYTPRDYLQAIGEHVVPHSYVPIGYVKEAGYPNGITRVNTLARLNVADRMATPRAQKLFEAMRDKIGRPAHQSFAFHWARLVEAMEALEMIEKYLKDDDIIDTDPAKLKVTDVKHKAGRGIGVVEAPRGTLVYDLTSDDNGICTSANIIVSTNLNTGGIEKEVRHAANAILKGDILSKIKLSPPKVK